MIFLFVLIPVLLKGQDLAVDSPVLDAGIVEKAGSVSTYAVLRNESAKVQYLLRANSSKQVDVYASRKKLEPGDTLHLRLRYKPVIKGKFAEEVEVYVSGKETPIPLVLKGEILNLVQDELQACVSFAPKERAFNSSVMQIPAPGPHVPMPPGNTDETLDPEKFLPVNLILLIDISGSMNDSQKLPLLKSSMRDLFKVLRPGDRVSILTYASEVQILGNGIQGNEQKQLLQLTDSLKAGGLTAGSQGLRQAYELADQQYIKGGNNQVILATDGNFNVRNAERKMIAERAGERLTPIKLSVLAYGDEATFHKRLKVLSDLGNGGFVYVKNSGKAESTLLEEIKKHAAISKTFN
jgi:hypothetical protein